MEVTHCQTIQNKFCLPYIFFIGLAPVFRLIYFFGCDITSTPQVSKQSTLILMHFRNFRDVLGFYLSWRQSYKKYSFTKAKLVLNVMMAHYFILTGGQKALFYFKYNTAILYFKIFK